MKYGELISISLYRKLSCVSFRSPRKNLEVHIYLKSIEPLLEYVEKERNKLMEKYCIPTDTPGTYHVTPKFSEKFDEMLNMEIEQEIKPLNLSADDFYDEECSYPADKSLWLNAAEINRVLEL